jgi:hypothetical protein
MAAAALCVCEGAQVVVGGTAAHEALPVSNGSCSRGKGAAARRPGRQATRKGEGFGGGRAHQRAWGR